MGRVHALRRSDFLVCVRPAKLTVGKPREMRVPCGQCIECRLKRSRDWAVRCMHEASLHKDNRFLTLTYADAFLPRDGSLDRRAFPLFMKRLRKACGSVRYFHAGEYGEENGRPHYHALLFGLRFGDEEVCGESRGGHPVVQSARLSALWPFGFSQLGTVTFESAAYVARYCVKKVTGEQAAAYYGGREPEYATMSRRPGIGFRWYEQFRGEVYRDDSVLARGHEVGPPRFYDKKEAELDAARMEVVKARRIRKHGDLCTRPGVSWRTNAARELIAVAKLRQLEGV